MSLTWSRRTFLQAAGVSTVGFALAGAIGGTPATADTTADAFAIVRSRWAALTSGGTIDAGNPVYAPAIAALDTSTANYLPLMETSPGATQLFTDLPLGSNADNVAYSFYRLGTLARAYVTPGTAYTGNASVLAAVTSGLDYMTTSVYSASGGLPTYGYGNWWDWEIGAPQSLLDTANLVYSALTPAQIANYCAAADHFVPDPTLLPQASGTTVSTGANRLDLCRVAIIRGALGDDASKIAQGVAAISPTLAFTAGPPGSYADGLYADGSFLQHGGTGYTGTYGGVWLGDVVKLMAALSGTPWAVTDPNIGNVFFAATNCFAPVVYNGLMLDSVRGRAIARSGEPDSADGISAAQNLITLAGGAPDTATATRLKSIAKGWLQRTPADITGSSIATIALAQQVLTDATVPAAPEPNGHSLFPVMARAVHRRPGWAAAIAMNSARNPFYETDGASNLHGWHTSDGMTYLYLDGDNTQYDDYFWPTVDPYRLPGTTSSLLPLTDG
ncbi:hypothetical protein ABH940_006650, partial [Streptacidiphilus sp. BW17]|uniref:polysaccharide lyase family 8 super-sandwich domain-containing protein n=1 Tax=Streptacidiphilus sp. BW17 TaxID=3156274 RepID=UPI0035143BC6